MLAAGARWCNVLPPMATPPRTSIPGLGSIFLVVFLDILGFSLVLPFLAAEARDTFHTSELVGTLLGAIYSLMQFLFVPVWGRVSDRVGRRPVLVWSVLATAVGMAALGLGMVFAQSVALLFVARAASGIDRFDEMLERAAATVPALGLARIEDVGAAAAFLGSAGRARNELLHDVKLIKLVKPDKLAD